MITKNPKNCYDKCHLLRLKDNNAFYAYALFPHIAWTQKKNVVKMNERWNDLKSISLEKKNKNSFLREISFKSILIVNTCHTKLPLHFQCYTSISHDKQKMHRKFIFQGQFHGCIAMVAIGFSICALHIHKQ